MLLTITLSIFALVAFNFVLLKLSVNKTARPIKNSKKPIVFTPTISLEQPSETLAPTGS